MLSSLMMYDMADAVDREYFNVAMTPRGCAVEGSSCRILAAHGLGGITDYGLRYN